MISLSKVEAQAPGLVNLAKTAAVSLEKAGLAGQRAAVQLVLDHSGSMRGFYRDGSVQRLAEQTLGLSVNLDDDGSVPVSYFGASVDHTVDVRLDNYVGIIDTTHTASAWGSTNYVAAMQAAVEEHDINGFDFPGLVIFQTDGEPNDAEKTKRALRSISNRPLFFAFVGFGPERNMRFLQQLDTLDGRQVDNASFFHAADPHTVTDEALYDGITGEFAGWLAAARAAGIVQ
ncbi:VWA domain-containing protein [Streptomyces sp. ME02-8801-2C]|uniref:VWA domain-containing protein n=1 Tax=Streptomyces sp. ME02-8801-2C TaxID=3028680 RepID=UPI0029A718F1|nr:VWA domain-containing protein [Streptomyces sp. ME02-8801-2C]MDX3455088.1 VWA domain-containing protein [Streptomyces sp. ME02-8801-2C]